MTIARYPFALPKTSSPFYAREEFNRPQATYSPGDYGPPADGVEYRAVYNPRTHEYVSARSGHQVSGLGDLAQPQAPMLSADAGVGGGFLASLQSWYWPQAGFTWKTAALWTGTALLARKLLG